MTSAIENSQIKTLDSIWLKAAIAGGLWASVEIIAGSFLHNIRIPFAGSILASLGVIIVIAFYQLWPEKGLIWRAGLICALMKSVSPSAIILGPMTGIFLEALVIELAIYIFGNNVFGYITGGILSLLSALVHKAFSLLLLFGFNIVKIYVNIYYYAAKQVSIENVDPRLLIFLFLLIYVIIGAISALTGYYIGKHSKIEKSVRHTKQIPPAAPYSFFPVNENQKFSGFLIVFHIIMIPSCLLLLHQINIIISLSIVITYISICIFYYRHILYRLKKPFFWFQLLFITLLAVLFWKNPDDENTGQKFYGLLVGLEMNIRAVLVVVGFSSFSVELRNPVVKSIIYKKGFQKPYQALSLAFSILPSMIAQLSKPGKFFTHPFKAVGNLILYAEDLLTVLETKDNGAST